MRKHDDLESGGVNTVEAPERPTLNRPQPPAALPQAEDVAAPHAPPHALSQAHDAPSPLARRWKQWLPTWRTTTAAGSLRTFQGVYRPTILMLLGVILFLRQGFVVGQAGLLGVACIIGLTFLITGTTAMSLSSITTNIRVGAGGVFAIISQALGLETGGSIALPLYFARALSSALYIYGFSEMWLYVMPHHPQWLVAYLAFAVVFGVTLLSTRFAFRLQGLVLVVIVAALASMLLGWTQLGAGDTPRTFHNPQLIGAFEAGSFWLLFAIFFPAGTGITVGASMSSMLATPRRSIPLGTLAAWGTALCVYFVLSLWFATVASPEELSTNMFVAVDHAAFGPLVLAGILAATFNAALASMVVAPRMLQALAEHAIVPRHAFFRRLSAGGEPRNAVLATGVFVAATLLLGSLDRIAVLITVFFLLSYLAINIVVLIEQSLGMISFRPIFRVPLMVPLVGTATCLLAVFVISPTFALVALSVIIGVYVWLVGRKLESPWQTVRSSIFVSLASWAARRIARSPDEANERSWKPDLLVPVESRAQLDGNFRFLRVLAEPRGSIQIVGVACPATAEPAADTLPAPVAAGGASVRAGERAAVHGATPAGLPAFDAEAFDPGAFDPGAFDGVALEAAGAARDGAHRDAGPATAHTAGQASGEVAVESLADRPAIRGYRRTRPIDLEPPATRSLEQAALDFQNEGLFATAVSIEASSFVKGVQMSAAVMRGNYFRPNVLFVNAHLYDEATLQGLVDTAAQYQLGVAFLFEHPEAALGHERRVNVWVRDQSPDWPLGLRLANLDLSLLLGYQIYRNWRGQMRLLTVCKDPADRPVARAYLDQLVDDARLPPATECWVEAGGLTNRLPEAPRADLQIFGLARTVDRQWMQRVVARSGSSCLFVRDSGRESALA